MKENRIDIMLNAQIKYTEKLWKEKEELQQKIDKAIEYLKTFHFIDNIRVLDIKEYEKLLEILGDKEIEEIPLFEGTLEQLNNLSILGDKE